MIGFIDPYTFTNIPVGLIVPYDVAGAAPTGWSLLTTPNTGVSGFSGCYIVGAGTAYTVGQSGIGGSPYGQVSFNSIAGYTAENGLHTGGTFNTITGSGGGGGWLAYGSADGEHVHQVDVTPTLGFVQTQFIKATSAAEKFPANAILLNTTHSTIPWLTATKTGNKFLRAGNSSSSASTSSTQTINALGINGDHDHNWSDYSSPNDDPASPSLVKYTRIFTGAQPGWTGWHNHSFSSVVITEYIKKVYTTAWTYASSFSGFRGMIAFWDGVLSSIPTGWQLCNGTNGTIDMRDHFIMMSTAVNLGTKTGTNVINVAPAAGSNLFASNDFGVGINHVHFDPVELDAVDPTVDTNNVYRATLHPAFAVPHYHPGSAGTSLSFYPQFCALYIIQKM